MRVVSRKLNESFTVTRPDGTVERYTIYSLRGSRVEIAVDVPADTKVEWEKKKEKKEPDSCL